MKRSEIEWMPIASIKPYDRNPRKNDQAVEKVANSITEFGFQSPIIVDRDMTIICGHTRWKAAKFLGMKEAPVVIASELSEEQARAYRLADNSTGDIAEWDYDLLDGELADLPEFEPEEFGLASTADAESMLDQFTATEALDRGSTDPTTLQMTLLFPIDCADAIKGYLKDHSKDEPIDACLQRMGIST